MSLDKSDLFDDLQRRVFRPALMALPRERSATSRAYYAAERADPERWAHRAALKAASKAARAARSATP